MMAHFFTETIGNEVYVYMNGKLLYKRWKNSGHSLVFNNSELPYSKHTFTSITNEGIVVNIKR